MDGELDGEVGGVTVDGTADGGGDAYRDPGGAGDPGAARSWEGALTAAWVVTRGLLLLMVFRVLKVHGPDVTSDVSVIYHNWYEVLRHGRFPEHDVTWQYPPAAGLVMLAPALLPFLGYASAFFWLAWAADAVVFVLLLRAGDGREAGRRPLGAWLWVAGVPLLGPTAYARYDLMVTAVAVAGLLAAARHPRVAGALVAFGAMLKVWPVLILLGARPGRSGRRLLGWAAGGVALLAAVFAVAMPGAFSFLTYQRDRGTEVESLGALVFHIGRHLGWQGPVVFSYGSMEFAGPHVALVSHLALGLSVVAFGWLGWWRWRARAAAPGTFGAAATADAAFTAVLLFTTTSRVISPQYMIWLVGLAAACATWRASVQLAPALLVLAATGVTFMEFPVWFGDVVMSDPWGLFLLLLRNGLLVAASVVAARNLWRSTVPARTAGAERPAGRAAEEGNENEKDDGDLVGAAE
jgi:hypothetical protein